MLKFGPFSGHFDHLARLRVLAQNFGSTGSSIYAKSNGEIAVSLNLTTSLAVDPVREGAHDELQGLWLDRLEKLMMLAFPSIMILKTSA